MLNYSLISNPTKRTVELLKHKMIAANRALVHKESYGAVAILQAPVYAVYRYADVGLKSGNVVAVEILGNCPQSVGSIAFFGEMDAVKSALAAAVYAEEQR